jgi:hypothetical protein
VLNAVIRIWGMPCFRLLNIDGLYSVLRVDVGEGAIFNTSGLLGLYFMLSCVLSVACFLCSYSTVWAAHLCLSCAPSFSVSGKSLSGINANCDLCPHAHNIITCWLSHNSLTFSNESQLSHSWLTVRVKVKVTLRMTVGQSVSKPSGTCDQLCFFNYL